jgi:hypothetical protein
MIPNPTRPDYYWENQYYLDEEKSEREAMERSNKAVAKNTHLLLSLLFKLLSTAFLWSSGLISAYFILKGFISPEQVPIWKRVGLIIGTAYVLNCVIFFLKGIMVALRFSGRKIWLLLWLVNCCFICLPPAILFYLIVESFITPTKGLSSPNLWGLCASVLTVITVYRKAGLSMAQTPKSFDWIFRIGKNILK